MYKNNPRLREILNIACILSLIQFFPVQIITRSYEKNLSKTKPIIQTYENTRETLSFLDYKLRVETYENERKLVRNELPPYIQEKIRSELKEFSKPDYSKQQKLEKLIPDVIKELKELRATNEIKDYIATKRKIDLYQLLANSVFVLGLVGLLRDAYKYGLSKEEQSKSKKKKEEKLAELGGN